MPRCIDEGVYRSTVAAWKLATPATVQERRAMKKVAQPEHAYTGYVPRWPEEEQSGLEKRRHAPILGYKGFLRREEDRVGTTFTRGVEIAARPGVLTASDIAHRVSPLASASERPTRARKLHGEPASGYGEFAGASGYGEFAAPESGYGAFDGASGYGAFQAPQNGKENGNDGSGYGAFDGASGYGAFQSAPEFPNGVATPRYGMFDGASGYGEFGAPQSGRGGSGYGEFDGASGYGQFLDAPSSRNQCEERASQRRQCEQRSPRRSFPDGNTTGMRYAQAIRACGGNQAVQRLWQVAAHSVSQRYVKRTELLQAVKRSFEKRERENGGRMTKEHLEEALKSLSCVLTDDQVTALFGTYDMSCSGKRLRAWTMIERDVTADAGGVQPPSDGFARLSGSVPMDTLLVALTDHLGA